ncbi:MAG: STAS domain-containing protein, partial [Candidatus Rokuibacteriota bacterium]
MQISRRQAGDFMDVRVKGRLDGYWADHLTRALEQVVREGSHRIRVNLAEVTYISSIGIRVLVHFYQQLQGIQGVFVVSSPSEPVKRVLDLARLGELLMPETPPPAAEATVEIPRALESASATFEARRLAPGSSLECRVTGDPALLIGCRFTEQHCSAALFPDSTLGIGLGAFGNSFEDCRPRFGEFLALAGAAAYLPTDGSNVADYLLAEGALVPEVQVLYSISCEGSFAHLGR